MAANARSSCSIVPASSSLFNPVPPCAQWSENSNKALFDVACQFLPDADGGSTAFDGGNFSYGFLLGRAGSVGQFGLTVDPDIHLYVRFSLLYFRAIFLPSYARMFLFHRPSGKCRRLKHRRRDAARASFGYFFGQHPVPRVS